MTSQLRSSTALTPSMQGMPAILVEPKVERRQSTPEAIWEMAVELAEKVRANSGMWIDTRQIYQMMMGDRLKVTAAELHKLLA